MNFDLVKKIFLGIALIVAVIICIMHPWLLIFVIIGGVIYFIDRTKKQNAQKDVDSTINRWTNGGFNQ